MAAVNSEPGKYTVDQVAKYVKTKKDLYELAVSNGFYLSSLKSNAICEEFLVGILTGKCWCPKYADVKRLLCPRPPAKAVLVTKFKEAIKAKGHECLLVEVGRAPDTKWLLHILATLTPLDEIFKKGYVAPRKR